MNELLYQNRRDRRHRAPSRVIRKCKTLPLIDADKRGSEEIAKIAGIAKIAEIENPKP